MINSQQFNTGLQKKHYKSEFIYKLVDIMKNYSSLASWVQNGSCIQFFKIDQIQKTVLPTYFRHSNFQSFLRQLHLYNFRQKKQFKNRHVFQHYTFKKGSQNEFITIQRTKKKKQKKQLLKQLYNNDILQTINKNITLSENQKQILTTMFTFKFLVLQKQKNLKIKLNELIQHLKTNRNPKVKEILTIYEEQIKIQLQGNKKYSKSIDLFLQDKLEQLNLLVKQKQKAQKSQKTYKELNKQLNEVNQKSKLIFQVQEEENQSEQLNYNKNYQYSYQSQEINQNQQLQYTHNNKNIIVYNLQDQINAEKNNQMSFSRQNQLKQAHYFPHQARSQEMIRNFSQASYLQSNLGKFNLQSSVIFLPLPFYKKSMGSWLFDPCQQNFQSQNYDRIFFEKQQQNNQKKLFQQQNYIQSYKMNRPYSKQKIEIQQKCFQNQQKISNKWKSDEFETSEKSQKKDKKKDKRVKKYSRIQFQSKLVNGKESQSQISFVNELKQQIIQ